VSSVLLAELQQLIIPVRVDGRQSVTSRQRNDEFTIGGGERVWIHNEASIRVASHLDNGALDLSSIADGAYD